MTAGELALVVGTVLCALAFTAVVVTLLAVRRTLLEVNTAMAQLRDQTVPMAADLRAAVSDARGDLERFDRLLGSAEAISGAVGGVSRLAGSALSTPVIKTVALASGTSRAARRLRGKD